MANVIGKVQGFTSKGPKAGESTRLGSEYVRAEANTWRTFIEVETQRDGSAQIWIRRDGQAVAVVEVNKESDARAIVDLFDPRSTEPVGAVTRYVGPLCRCGQPAQSSNPGVQCDSCASG